MAETSRDIKRYLLAKQRLENILKEHTIALWRTLEQKISDAGPYNQRIDPHILTPARQALEEEGRIIRIGRGSTPWFYLAGTPSDELEQRLSEQEPIHNATQDPHFTNRMGQTLEIAVYKALRSQHLLEFLGAFPQLDTHDDSRRYHKQEPTANISGRVIPGGGQLDFLIRHPTAGWAAVEVKNIREWLYPQRNEIKELLAKACHLDAVPVLIARRRPFVTFKVLHPCGVVIWETRTQRYPFADQELAEKVRHKNLLGYFDVRVGNDPDEHLTRFIHHNLPDVLPRARARFDNYKDLLKAFAFGDIDYREFTARVRRREKGIPENSDWEEDFEG